VQWSSDGKEVTIVWLLSRHEPLRAISYRIAGPRAVKMKEPYDVKNGSALDKFFIKDCTPRTHRAQRFSARRLKRS
jgi:hypothetical protein